MALSGTVLVALNMVTLFLTAIAWFMIPSGVGDTNHIEGAWFTAFTGTVLAVLTALLTVVPVLAKWLGKWWFVVPAVLFVVATARWVYIDAEYPEPPGPYGYGFDRMAGPVGASAQGVQVGTAATAVRVRFTTPE